MRGLLFPTEALRAPRLANSIWMWDQPSQWFRTNRWRLYSYFTSFCSRNTLCRWRRKTGRDGSQVTYHFLIISGSTEAVPVPTQLPHLGTGLQKVNCYLIRLGKKTSRLPVWPCPPASSGIYRVNTHYSFCVQSPTHTQTHLERCNYFYLVLTGNLESRLQLVKWYNWIESRFIK